MVDIMINELSINESIDFCRTPDCCPYLDGKQMRTEYKYINDCSFNYNSDLVKRGWRRFGKYFFRPVCDGCSECHSIAVDIENFTLTRSMKKAQKRNAETTALIQEPILTLTHLKLYDKFHRYKQKKNNWTYHQITPKLYHENYIEGKQSYTKEVLFIVDQKIVGIDYVDIVDDGLSSIYFFHDPDYAHLSLGTYSLLYQIELAKRLNLRWIYLGYYVKACPSLSYKARYQPYTTLQGSPELHEKPIWI
jgi:arginine-tRNA-protein transferase